VRLLYVDDDRVNLLLFEHGCAALPGVQVITATNGAEAMQVTRLNRPDLLVLDLRLPDTDGCALLQALRNEGGLDAVPAFLCSADDSSDLRRAASAAGFDGFWAKPVDNQMLRRQLVTLGFMVPG
jgi:two-component system OmpR family response regulator